MKKFILSLLLILISTSAFATDAALIRLHPPKNPNNFLFGQDSLCHVQSVDPSTGYWTGVCRYVGYRNVQQFATVMWDDTGAGTYIQPCAQYPSRVGVPCPKETYGPYSLIVLNGQSYQVFVQGVDAAGVTAIELSGGPPVPALITPQE